MTEPAGTLIDARPPRQLAHFQVTKQHWRSLSSPTPSAGTATSEPASARPASAKLCPPGPTPQPTTGTTGRSTDTPKTPNCPHHWRPAAPQWQRRRSGSPPANCATKSNAASGGCPPTSNDCTDRTTTLNSSGTPRTPAAPNRSSSTRPTGSRPTVSNSSATSSTATTSASS